MTHRHHSGFTLIEILLVVTIIATLSGIILSVIPLINRTAKRNKTQSILTILHNAFASSALRQGASISPSTHPLARSAENRSIFVRAGTTINAAGSTIATEGATVPISGKAFIATDHSAIVPALASTLLLPSDRYQGASSPSDCPHPALFALPRYKLAIISSNLGLMEYQRIPAIGPFNDPDGNKVLDATSTEYTATKNFVAKSGSLNDPDAFEIEAKKMFDYAIGESAGSELASLGALFNANKDTIPTLSTEKLFRVDSSPASTEWRPGHLGSQGSWTRYRLRGPAVYDAWGNEVLSYLDSGGDFTCESAGADGYFVWHPGKDGSFSTQAHATQASGDDRDASADNIIVGAKP